MDFDVLKALVDWAWAIVAALILLLNNKFKDLNQKVDNTYSKQEVKDLLEMRINPLIDALDRHSDSIKDQTKVLEKLTDSFQLLHRDIAVVKVRVEAMETHKYDDSSS